MSPNTVACETQKSETSHTEGFDCNHLNTASCGRFYSSHHDSKNKRTGFNFGQWAILRVPFDLRS